MAKPKVYLAGPEVFLANVQEIAAAKKALCAQAGLDGVFPFDAEIAELDHLGRREQAQQIGRENERLMRASDAIIANCTPFRSVSMDIGTGYEIGFMRGLGKPAFGYSNVTPLLAERTRQYNAALGRGAIDPYSADADIENFGLFENLMIAVALHNFDCDVVLRDVPAGAELTNLEGFAECVEIAAGVLS